MIDGLLSIGIGTFMCLLAYEVIVPKKDVKKLEAWRHAMGPGLTFLRFAGPLIILFGVYSFLSQFS